jgi:hypothetical protein
LKDRIDVVVRAVPFNSNFTQSLVARVESDSSPEDLIPTEIIFSPDELDAIYKTILSVEIPTDPLDRMAYFLGQLDFCRLASPQFEFMNKDTLRLASQTVAAVCTERCPLDKRRHLCSQTENGVSARTYLTCIHFAKALAYFRGHQKVELEDIRQILPWVLHDKLIANRRSPFFLVERNAPLLQDRISWIRTMFDMAMEQYGGHKPFRDDVREARDQIDEGLVGVNEKEVRKRLGRIASLLNKMMKQELSGPLYEDLIQLKAIHSRYQNYLHWLRSGA